MTIFTAQNKPLPITWKECKDRNWDYIDILLVTGDAYIDHPTFGVALIGRLLESHGYRVAVLPQPRIDRPDDFIQFKSPRLFVGISAGNLDSIVANYSGNGRVRNIDAYSPHGNPWRSKKQTKTNRYRPDRASIVYTSLAKAAFKNTPIILGGVEASLRRFVHFDYKQNKLRGSILSDAKGDLLVYGMAEKSIVEVANRIRLKTSLKSLYGSCQRLTEKEVKNNFPDLLDNKDKYTILPSWEDIQNEVSLFLEAEKTLDQHARSYSSKIIFQQQQSAWIVQFPSYPLLSTKEMDDLYELPYTRKPHPSTPDIPAYKTIQHSITIVRGCSGNCSFCAISRHQGPITISRSKSSITKEATLISQMDNFNGTISDLGGPTANLYGTYCKIETCKKHDCLYPKLCHNLAIDEHNFTELLKSVSRIKKVKHVFISSGLRMELLLRTPKLLQQIIAKHTPGMLKIAPEHTENNVLSIMHKEPHAVLEQFVSQCRKYAKKLGKKIHFTPYIILSHPGSSVKDTKKLCKKLKTLNLPIRQFQDFTPTPGTLSTAMYVTGLNRDSNEPVKIVKNQSERQEQRRILERNLVKQ